MEKAMAPHSSTLAWKTPWMEEPGRLQSMGLLRVGHDWMISLSLSCIGEGNGNSLQCSCLENPRDRGARWAAIYGVAQSRTRLKRLSSSSSSSLANTRNTFTIYFMSENNCTYSLENCLYKIYPDVKKESWYLCNNLFTTHSLNFYFNCNKYH